MYIISKAKIEMMSFYIILGKFSDFFPEKFHPDLALIFSWLFTPCISIGINGGNENVHKKCSIKKKSKFLSFNNILQGCSFFKNPSTRRNFIIAVVERGGGNHGNQTFKKENSQ